MNVKFQKYRVTDGVTHARVFYSLDNRCDGRKCVTLYARDYSGALGKVFATEYQNDTDLMTDYFDQGRVVLFAGHPLYAAARARAEQNLLAASQKRATRDDRPGAPASREEQHGRYIDCGPQAWDEPRSESGDY